MGRKLLSLVLIVLLLLSTAVTAFAVEGEEVHIHNECTEPHDHHDHPEGEAEGASIPEIAGTETPLTHTHDEDGVAVATPSDLEPPAYSIWPTRNGWGFGMPGPPPKPGISPLLVGSRPCLFNGCSNSVTVTGKHSFVCNTHKCKIAGCPWVYYQESNKLCQVHAGRTNITCQISVSGGLCGLPSVGNGSPCCWYHHCPGCFGPGNGDGTLCDLCMQCWVPGCPNFSTCTNECDLHCPHSCKVHHANHCTACHTDPCTCLPANPTISVKLWNNVDNSVAVDIISARATEIELYTAGGVKFATLSGASGTHTFRYNAPQNNGSYYVRVRNAKGYNTGSYPFQVATLDVAAPVITGKTIQPDNSVWAASKTLTVTATDQTNATFSLRYADGSPVPGCPDKAGTASGGVFTTAWTLTEQLASAKTFKIIASDKWGYASETTIAVSGIDGQKPTKPSVSLSDTGDWHNEAVTVTIYDGSATSGIAYYQYRVNGGAWQTGSTVTVSAEGIHTVEAKVISHAGLESDIVGATVKLDLTKPTAPYTLSPDGWTTDRMTITLAPADAGGSGLASVTLPDGRTVYDFSNIQFPALENGDYRFTLMDKAGNSAVVVVPVSNIAILDVTATLSAPFVISPNTDRLYAGDISFQNHSNVPISLTLQGMTAYEDAPELVGPNAKDWKSLTASETKRYLALGLAGNGVDFWVNEQPHTLGVIAKSGIVSYAMQGRFGYAWEKSESFLYGLSVKVSMAG